MEEISEIIIAYRSLVIDNLFIGLVLIKLFSLFFAKDAYPVSKNIARWLIIACAAASLLNWILYMGINDPALPERANGSYWWAFWMMIFFSDLLPFVLLLNRLKNKLWVLLIVVLLMNFAKGMELFASSGATGNGWGVGYTVTPLVSLLLGSILIAIFITLASLVVMKYCNTSENDIKPLQ